MLAAAAAGHDPGQDKVHSSAELSVFTAALLGEDHHSHLLDLLAENDIFFIARVLRLSVPADRTSHLSDDLVRYQHALEVLAPAAGPQPAKDLQASTALVAQGTNWTALTHSRQADGAVLPDYEDLVAAAAHGEEVVVWQDNPLASRLPEHLAAAEVLMRFKRPFDRLTQDDLEMQQPCPPAPEDSEELTARVLDHARSVAEAERALRTDAGLHASPTLPTLEGEPHLTISAGNGGRWIEEIWGHANATVTFDGEWDADADPWDGVARFLDTDATRAARKRLRAHVEKGIGSSLGSAAWNRPTALAGWIW